MHKKKKKSNTKLLIGHQWQHEATRSSPALHNSAPTKAKLTQQYNNHSIQSWMKKPSHRSHCFTWSHECNRSLSSYRFFRAFWFCSAQPCTPRGMELPGYKLFHRHYSIGKAPELSRHEMHRHWWHFSILPVFPTISSIQQGSFQHHSNAAITSISSGKETRSEWESLE